MSAVSRHLRFCFVPAVVLALAVGNCLGSPAAAFAPSRAADHAGEACCSNPASDCCGMTCCAAPLHSQRSPAKAAPTGSERLPEISSFWTAIARMSADPIAEILISPTRSGFSPGDPLNLVAQHVRLQI